MKDVRGGDIRKVLDKNPPLPAAHTAVCLSFIYNINSMKTNFTSTKREINAAQQQSCVVTPFGPPQLFSFA
jgi:hypothetical protein